MKIKEITSENLELVKIINDKLKRCERLCTMSNDGQESEEDRKLAEDTQDDEMKSVEKLSKMLGVTSIIWPGIFPAFKDSKDYTFHTIEEFLKWNNDEIKEESVIRYVLTHLKEPDFRIMNYPHQGRYTFETREEAEAQLKATIENNNSETLKQIYGENPKFEVRDCRCYSGHFDPMQTVFKTYNLKPINDAFQAHVQYGMPECDENLNQACRQLVKEIIKDHGKAYIYKINLFEGDNAVTELKEGDMIYNFCGDYVSAKKCEHVKAAILKRKNATYEGTKKDSNDLQPIYDFLEHIEAYSLHWS